MTRRTRSAAVAAIATALIAAGSVTPSQAGGGQVQPTAKQADERRVECVRQKKIAGLPVRSLLCLTVKWDASTRTTTLVGRLRVINGTKQNRSLRMRFSTYHGAFHPDDVYDHGLGPRGSVTYTEERTVSRYLDHPVAKSRVILYSGRTDSYSIAGKTLRATP